MGEPDGVAPGWIFSRGGFGVRSGKTLSEILLVRNTKVITYAVIGALRKHKKGVRGQAVSKTCKKLHAGEGVF